MNKSKQALAKPQLARWKKSRRQHQATCDMFLPWQDHTCPWALKTYMVS